MNEWVYRLYGTFHRIAKSIVNHENPFQAHLVRWSNCDFTKGVDNENASISWLQFIEKAVIPPHTEFEGSLYAGYIADSKMWCLPSWIWTAAATIRMYCKIDRVEVAESLGRFLANKQLACGGWVVRNDYDHLGAIPMLAPNDSAYIANNAFISLYEATHDSSYLKIAMRCADWIIQTARPDGIVHNGYNTRDQKWDKHCVIVDIGFTGGLFARLYEITQETKYKRFLKRFIYKYIELFYISAQNGFCTSIDANDCRQGGMFGRGQAWALEGLIPAYKILRDEYLYNTIISTIDHLIRMQKKDGSWAYNLSKPLMGVDCKAVSVIAKNLMDWYAIEPHSTIKQSAERALMWCRKNTANQGEAEGGIFSYCLEGAIVHDLYTSCAFVYSSAYAIELDQMLKL